MDRDKLSLRNQKKAESLQATPLRHQFRRIMLNMMARVPVSQKKPASTPRILLIRPDHLGDVLLTTPAIHALRNALPQAEIHALVGPWSSAVLTAYEEIDTILTLPFPGFAREAKSSLISPYTLLWRSGRKLRAIGFSHAIVMRPDHWWGALLAYVAGIPERIGFSVPGVYPFLTRQIPRVHMHSVMRNIHLIERGMGISITNIGNVLFRPSRDDHVFVENYLNSHGVAPHQAIFCIHPGSGASIKNWSSTGWAKVADNLIEELGAEAVVTGSSSEMPLVQDVIGQMGHPAHNLAGKTGIGQLGALYARSSLVIGPDSGPLHLAAAVGTPTVTLFGPADPDQFAPWGPDQKHIVLTSDIKCRPCGILDWHDDNPHYHPCVREISIQEICDAALQVAMGKNS